MTKDEALKLALEALKKFHYAMIDAGVLDRQEVLNEGFTAATAIKEALAQLEQDDGMCTACENNLCTAKQGCVALDNPPQRTWVGLTDEEIDVIDEVTWDEDHKSWGIHDFARATEAKLKQKNGYAEEKNTRQDGDCKHCVNGCPACDARRQSNVLP